MFERFTDRARRVVVLAQEEARELRHDYIGTEHLLLGIVHDGEGVAATALTQLGESLQGIRAQVVEIVGEGPSSSTGHIPFTPRAKKVLELGLREALQLGHQYVGSEHLLLGIVREGEGVAAQVLERNGLSLGVVRQQVIRLLSGYTGVESGSTEDVEGEAGGAQAVAGWVGYEPRGPRRPWPPLRRRRPAPASPACASCGADLTEAARHRTLAVPDEAGERTLDVAVVFCRRCGNTVTGQVLSENEPKDGA